MSLSLLLIRGSVEYTIGNVRAGVVTAVIDCIICSLGTAMVEVPQTGAVGRTYGLNEVDEVEVEGVGAILDRAIEMVFRVVVGEARTSTLSKSNSVFKAPIGDLDISSRIQALR